MTELNPAIAGLQLSSCAANIRYSDRDDVLVMHWPEQASCAAVFTKNRFRAAPVIIAERNMAFKPRAALINAGNANAGTGAAGMAAAENTCQLLAKELGCNANQILPFSTGVIGELLPVPPFAAALPRCVQGLNESAWPQAAAAILTTDTRPKTASRKVKTSAGEVLLNGICKGSGMIRPDMATMLAYVATDAAIEQSRLQRLLAAANEQSFNRITVDGDTSTNDALLLVATAAGQPLADADEAAFAAALTSLCIELAQSIVRDGEGATKFISINVQGAANACDARSVADTIAHSPLVKTALFASDANWGRILAAIGRAPVSQMDLSKVDLYLGDVCLIRGGEPNPEYREQDGAAVVAETDIQLTVKMAEGDAAVEIWTCDLSHDYVSINADYRS